MHQSLSSRWKIVSLSQSSSRRRHARISTVAPIVARLPFDPPIFNPDKLSVTFLEPSLRGDPSDPSLSSRASSGASASPSPRHYTLTHNDLTGALRLSIGPRYNHDQISGWYTRLLRDEVLAEWVGAAELHVHVHISGEHGWWLAPPALRNYIFRREMSLVLDSIRYADRTFLSEHPSLARADVVVHFHSDNAQYDRSDPWGTLDEPASWPPGLPPSFQPEPLIPAAPARPPSPDPCSRCDGPPAAARSPAALEGHPPAPRKGAPPVAATQGVEVTTSFQGGSLAPVPGARPWPGMAGPGRRRGVFVAGSQSLGSGRGNINAP